jgi:DNA-binding NarL/FixJ family response regulator
MDELPTEEMLPAVLVVLASRPVWAHGIAAICRRFVRTVVVAQARSEDDAKSAVCRYSADVALVDLASPSAVSILHGASQHHGTRLLALGHLGTPAEERAAPRLGASAYVSPEATIDDFIRSIRGSAERERAPSYGRSAVTRRESEVADLVARGFTNGQIADELSISVSTVKNHVHRLLAKLAVASRIEAGAVWRSTNSALDRNWI